MIKDKNVAWKLCEVEIPVQHMSGIGITTIAGSSSATTSGITYVSSLSYTTTSISGIDAITGITTTTGTTTVVTGVTGSVEAAAFTSLGAGNPVISDHSVGAAEVMSMKIGADGDEVYHNWRIPPDMNRDKEFDWRVIFSTASTDADTPTFTLDYQGVADGTAVADITADEETTWSGAVSTTANALEVPDWTRTDSGSYIASTDSHIKLRLTCTYTGGASADEIEVMALALRYEKKSTNDTNFRDVIETAPLDENY